MGMLRELRLDRHRTSLTTFFRKPSKKKRLGIFGQLGKENLRQWVYTDRGRKVLLVADFEEIE